jgi:hypothetical protein
MPILARRCRTPECENLEFSLLELNGRVTNMDQPDDRIDELGCPKCGADGERVIRASSLHGLGGAAGVSKDFPYFDTALGVTVQSKSDLEWHRRHRKDGTPREHILRSMEGAWDPEAEIDREAEQRAASERAYKEQIREQAEGPNKEAFGKLSDILREPGAIERLWRD